MSNRDIIVIGGSAGAAAPLKQILGRPTADLPPRSYRPAHSRAGHRHPLDGRQQHGQPSVRQAENGMKIEPGQIYLAAPDHHLLLAGDHLFLGRGPRENMVRPAIDALFRSAALYHGPRVIGVLLVNEALRVALRIIEERAELMDRMAADGRRSGRPAVAEMYTARAAEYRKYADMIRRVVLKSLDPPVREREA